MGGTHLIRHLTIPLFCSSPGIAPAEMGAAADLPAAAPGHLAEAMLALSPTSQLRGRGTVSWLHGAALPRDIRQRSSPGVTVRVGVQDDIAHCGAVQPVLSLEDPRHQE